MSRFILYKSPGPDAPSTGVRTDSQAPEVAESLREDARVKVIDQLSQAILIECEDDVAVDVASKLPDWSLQPERKLEVPDPRPKVKKPRR